MPPWHLQVLQLRDPCRILAWQLAQGRGHDPLPGAGLLQPPGWPLAVGSNPGRALGALSTAKVIDRSKRFV